MSSLTAQTILAQLDTERIGCQIEVYQEIGSTNDRAHELARQAAPDGSIVIAEHQTAGRGRLDRRWHAPPGSSLLMSILLRPNLAPPQAQRATMTCSLAAIRAIAQRTGLEATLKWPNDLHFQGKKLGGVLTELGPIREERLTYLIVGMGINVNLDPDQIPEAMTPPISLAAAVGQRVDRFELLLALLHELDELYRTMRAGWSPHESWRRHLSTLGQAVRVGTRDGVMQGLAEDVDADGALLVRTESGALKKVLVGDVTLRGQRIED